MVSILGTLYITSGGVAAVSAPAPETWIKVRMGVERNSGKLFQRPI
jgi:hypothetical protein